MSQCHRWAAVLAAAAMVAVTVPEGVAGTLEVPASTTVAPSGTASVTVGVPQGVRPQAVVGRIGVDMPIDGRIDFLVGGRLALSVPARPRARVSVPVSRADVVDHQITVGVQIVPASTGHGRCVTVPDVSASFDHVAL